MFEDERLYGDEYNSGGDKMESEEKLAKLLENNLFMEDGAYAKSVKFKELCGFEKIYPATNENLQCLFNNLKNPIRRVLTVGSSGDQVLYSILNGAKEVVLVDINPFAKEFLDFKIASIKTFAYYDFCKIFKFYLATSDKQYNLETKRIIRTNFLTSAVYKSISSNMNDESRMFWDNFFLEFDELDNAYTDGANLRFLGSYTKNKGIYNKLRARLIDDDFKINFINDDIKNLSQIIDRREKFDLILLSNVIDYFGQMKGTHLAISDIKRFKRQVVDRIVENLNANGLMQIDYLFSIISFMNSSVLLSDFNQVFGENNIFYIGNEGFILYKPTVENEK